MLCHRWLVIALLSGIGFGNAHIAIAAVPVAVAAELEQLKTVHGFTVTGVEYTADAVAHAESDDLLTRLSMLLENFNYVIVQTPDNQVARVIIMGEKVAYTPPPAAPIQNSKNTPATSAPSTEIALPTQRQGSSHVVTLTLEGMNNRQVQKPLLIDTGADQLVLPVSLIRTLGLSANTLRERQVQTANGQVMARIGNLPALVLGTQKLTNLPVAFIDDQRLGGQALLGMSVLGRFRFTIDDANNQILLMPK